MLLNPRFADLIARELEELLALMHQPTSKEESKHHLEGPIMQCQGGVAFLAFLLNALQPLALFLLMLHYARECLQVQVQVQVQVQEELMTYGGSAYDQSCARLHNSAGDCRTIHLKQLSRGRLRL